MKNPKRVVNYIKENLNEVKHTTLNPEGPGVVRIHMVPPKYDGPEPVGSVVILNGQDIIPLDDGSAVKLTIAKYFTPNGNDIHKVGITPDVEVERTYEDINAMKDPQMDKAKSL